MMMSVFVILLVVAGWMSEFSKEAKGSDKFPLHPKAPVAHDATGQDDCGGSGGWNLDVVGVVSPAVADAASGEGVAPGGADIGVAAAQDERDEVPRMIVEEALVVAAVPLVEPDGEPAEVEQRAVGVRALRLAQRFAPAELERTNGAGGRTRTSGLVNVIHPTFPGSICLVTGRVRFATLTRFWPRIYCQLGGRVIETRRSAN